MSDFVHNQGYIYPITNEEYEKLDEKIFNLKAKGYHLEVFDGQKGLNRYLVFLTYHSYGKKHDNFGSSRPCTEFEIKRHIKKFQDVLCKEIDKNKLKYIEYCWYNCSECFDYYEEEEDKPITSDNRRIATKTNVKTGDFVRLTDPISNGEIVRIDNVDEYGFASWIGGSQAADMKQISIDDVNPDLYNDYKTLSDLIGHIETEIGLKLYPESAVQHYKHIAEVDEKEHAYYEQAWNKEHNKLIETEERRKEWEETADELNKELNKWKKEVIDCTEANELLTAQVFCRDEEIERLKKRIKHLEADLEEGGFNDERNFI